MGLIDTIFDPSKWGSRTAVAKIQESETISKTEHLGLVNDLLEQQIRLREDNGMMSLKLEDYMWSPVAGWQTDQGFSLGTLQDEADHCRALFAINPLIKKAVNTRVGMIHGRGSRIIPKENGRGADAIERIVKLNSRRVFGETAQARLEGELSSTGNVWAMVRNNKPAVIVPISQIAGYITEVEDPSNVLYWKRSYQTQETNVVTGEQQTVIVTEYIPSSTNTAKVAQIGEVKVRLDARMVHIAANRQEGWILGLPDVFAAKFWTKGHKEMFEAGHEYALSQGQIAAKVTGGNGMSTQLAASRLADEPRRDYETGEVSGYGGVFMGSGGLDYQILGKMGSGVDFKSYDRIAGMIAAGTGVPLAVLLAESGSDEVSLEQSVVDDMKLRQKLWGEFFQDFFDQEVIVSWPRIKQETVYRVNQSLEISNRTNTLTAEERRLLALEAYGIEGDPNEVPDISQHPDVLVYKAKKELDLHYAPLIAEAEGTATEEAGDSRSTTPDQGNDQGVGKLSNGADAHDLRDSGDQ